MSREYISDDALIERRMERSALLDRLVGWLYTSVVQSEIDALDAEIKQRGIQQRLLDRIHGP